MIYSIVRLSRWGLQKGPPDGAAKGAGRKVLGPAPSSREQFTDWSYCRAIRKSLLIARVGLVDIVGIVEQSQEKVRIGFARAAAVRERGGGRRSSFCFSSLLERSKTMRIILFLLRIALLPRGILCNGPLSTRSWLWPSSSGCL